MLVCCCLGVLGRIGTLVCWRAGVLALGVYVRVGLWVGRGACMSNHVCVCRVLTELMRAMLGIFGCRKGHWTTSESPGFCENSESLPHCSRMDNRPLIF